jgi:Transglutaminase-like superfamily
VRPLGRLCSLPRQERWALIEAMLSLVLARMSLLIPFRWLAWSLGRLEPGIEQPIVVLGTNERDAALGVRSAVLRVAERLPWQSSCLVRALAARMMLQRRHLPSLLQLGVGRTRTELSAHAWVQCGEIDVVGAETAADFAPIAAFHGKARTSGLMSALRPNRRSRWLPRSCAN